MAKLSDEGKRVRLTLSLSRATEGKLKAVSALNGIALSRVAEALIEAGLTSGGEGEGGSKELQESIEALRKSHSRDTAEVLDLLSGFLLHYFASTPMIPDSEQKKAFERGMFRFKRFRQKYKAQLESLDNHETL